LSRAPHRRHHFESDDVLDDVAAERPDPAEQLAQTQSVQALQREINDLPQDMRDVLLMVALDEMGYEEAAVLLSIPVGTVRSRLSRARSTLRQRMAVAGIPLDF
jgi:RNA polymerase sigma factor (sigma-70 family)